MKMLHTLNKADAERQLLNRIPYGDRDVIGARVEDRTWILVRGWVSLFVKEGICDGTIRR